MAISGCAQIHVGPLLFVTASPGRARLEDIMHQSGYTGSWSVPDIGSTGVRTRIFGTNRNRATRDCNWMSATTDDGVSGGSSARPTFCADVSPEGGHSIVRDGQSSEMAMVKPREVGPV